MKHTKIFIAVIFITAFQQNGFSQAKDYKLLKFDFSLGAAFPAKQGIGFVTAFEPKVNISNKFAVGLKAEVALMARGASFNQNGGSLNVVTNFMVQPTVDFYITKLIFRPFVGIGAGVYNFGSNENTTADSKQSDFEKVSLFGICPRVGFEVWHFRVSGEYNIVPKTGVVDNNYASVKLGFFFGGGKK
ncbi:MAG: hypothetical protein H7321_01100 [Bacteroidia bacterium]|nr:hypothetical protein [Bacteroidia bacterium]